MERRSLMLHGHEVSYVAAGSEPGGDAPTLLLVHGLAGSADTWREVIPLLGDRYAVVAPDLLGHGRSAKPRHDYSLGAFASLLRDLLATLGTTRATVVGQSLGGGVAMQLAYQHPETCERLVLVGSGGLGREVSWLLRALSLPGTELLMPALFPGFVRDLGNAVSRRLESFGVRAPGIEEEWRAYASLTRPENRDTFVRTLRSVVDAGGQVVSAHDRLYLAAELPTLIVWGARDHIIPVEHAYAAHDAMPASRLEVFEHAGHFVHVEEPHRFVELLDDFVAANPPAAMTEPTREQLAAAPAAEETGPRH